jgi:SOS-response transcriptional repressor LexA
MAQENSFDTPQKRLKYFIEKQFTNNTDFAEAVGVSNSVVSKYTQEGGVVARSRRVLKRLSELGLNVEWYLTGKGSMMRSDAIALAKQMLASKSEGIIESIGEFVEVPIIESAFPCGKPETNEGKIVKVPFLKFIIGDVRNPYILKCEDDAMEPTLKRGDYIIIEGIDGEISKVHNSEIVVAAIDGEIVVRRFSRTDKYIVLSADNNIKYTPHVYPLEEEVLVLGIVRRKLETVDE